MLWVAISLAVLAILLGVRSLLRAAPPTSYDWDFWTLYSKVLAVAAVPFFGWLVYSASATSGAWWQSAPTVALVTAILGAVAPATTFVLSWAKIRLDDRRQQHEITNDYLNKALDADQSLATRHQLLRFLSTAPQHRDRLHVWAKQELERIGPAYERQEKDAQRAQAEIVNAKSPKELELAEEKLRAVVGRAERSRGTPAVPKVTIAALKAGFFSGAALGELTFPGANLDKLQLAFAKLAGSNLEGASLRDAWLQGCDLRMCKFDNADLKDAMLNGCDCRGATFVNADLQGAHLERTRLEGADLTGASLEQIPLRAVYDDATKWPAGFDPITAECVSV
jgi:uncharacterized protein YjbI with pentapeptide repeats